MRTEQRLGTKFTIRDDPKEIKEFLASIDDDGETLPERIITDENDGANGLWWQSFEQFWVELACFPEQLNPEILLHELRKLLDWRLPLRRRRWEARSAVNNHDALLAACKNLLDCLRSCTGDWEFTNSKESACAAIAKAEARDA